MIRSSAMRDRILIAMQLVAVVVWGTAAWHDCARYRAGHAALAWPIVDLLIALVFAALAWTGYARYQAKLRERAFAALAGPPPPARSEVLRLGSRGPAVLLWKDRLRELGYVVSADDVFDADTAAATAAYQDHLGLVSDGIVGPWTRKLGLRWRWGRIRR